MAEADPAPFGLYIHWPFCAAKCPYCDFNSHVRHKPVNQAEFLKAYLTELRFVATRTPGRTLSSIFFGGGTPSLMDPATVDVLLSETAKLWGHQPDIEITLEANPASADARNFRGYRSAGVNRVSLGVQSFHDDDLKTLGRLHSAREAQEAITLARDVFPRLSFDLIYARPNQSLSDWEQELEQAFAYAADHLSLYQLTIEPETPFAALHKRGRLVVPDNDLAADFYDLTQALTRAHGLPAYEISNHARPGAEARHNLLYWRYGEYAGIGAGAHGRLVGANARYATIAERHPESWFKLVMEQGHGFIEDRPLVPEEEADEMLIMGLRLKEGLSLPPYEQLRGRLIDQSRLETLLETGLVTVDDNRRLSLTADGFPVMDAIAAELAA
ncbi:radical SAM family heme chaperone HemW [Coralliovum pocilloporae]|uniref:radical SAM family heme chaperone HemW n=1 Tax=Coralliovum pocilloporae TaxID=3066369 RepID=UPI003306F019